MTKSLVVERVEGEALPAEAAHDMLHAKIGIEEPLPDEAGDDEGEREGIEEDGAEGVLEADLLVEQRGQHEADQQREHQRQAAVDQQVLDRRQPARRRPQPLVLVEPDEGQPRQQLRIGEGVDDRPDRAADEHDQRGQDHRDRGDLGVEIAEQLAGLGRRPGPSVLASSVLRACPGARRGAGRPVGLRKARPGSTSGSAISRRRR